MWSNGRGGGILHAWAKITSGFSLRGAPTLEKDLVVHIMSLCYVELQPALGRKSEFGQLGTGERTAGGTGR